MKSLDFVVLGHYFHCLGKSVFIQSVLGFVISVLLEVKRFFIPSYICSDRSWLFFPLFPNRSRYG